MFHIESGSFPSLLTGAKLINVIAQHDREHVITLRSASDTAGSCAASESRNDILTPSYSSISLLGQSGFYNYLTTDWEIIPSRKAGRFSH